MKKGSDDMDSDEDDDLHEGKAMKEEELETQDPTKDNLSPDDIRRQGEISEGVRKIKVRQGQRRFVTRHMC